MLTEKDREKLIELKASLSKEVDAVSMYYHVGFDDRGEVSFRYVSEADLSPIIKADVIIHGYRVHLF